MKKFKGEVVISVLLAGMLFFYGACSKADKAVQLSDQDIDNIVRRSFQYVAMYNVINKGAMMKENPMMTGWNGTFAAQGLQDHTQRGIARPNNDTIYVASVLDLRNEPVIVHYPAFDSKYVVLETSAYDHYCDIPLSTTKGDFLEPANILYYTARTQGYAGEPVEGVDIVKEMSGDFVIAFLRVMPHAAEAERLEKNLAAMREVKAQTLSEFLGKPVQPVDRGEFPPYNTDPGIFENNFLEVMQFVVNHTTFDANDAMDNAFLAAMKPLGVEPGKAYDPGANVAPIDGVRLAAEASKIISDSQIIWNDPNRNIYMNEVFKLKGQISPEAMVLQSAYGPIGLPSDQAVYPGIGTSDGESMNAQYDYLVRMSKEEMPPAQAFWSVTLYDAANGFFIPNDHKKYSVGENAGMKLNDEGGIEIYIAAEQPPGVPEENWLPINRGDEVLDLIMRIYDPDLEKMETWKTPKAEKIK
ncbi:DUF1214 domain-containing protein [Acidobacteriota bacterium]